MWACVVGCGWGGSGGGRRGREAGRGGTGREGGRRTARREPENGTADEGTSDEGRRKGWAKERFCGCGCVAGMAAWLVGWPDGTPRERRKVGRRMNGSGGQAGGMEGGGEGGKEVHGRFARCTASSQRRPSAAAVAIGAAGRCASMKLVSLDAAHAPPHSPQRAVPTARPVEPASRLHIGRSRFRRAHVIIKSPNGRRVQQTHCCPVPLLPSGSAVLISRRFLPGGRGESGGSSSMPQPFAFQTPL